MPKLRFTKTTIEAIEPPTNGALTLHDSLTPNLILLVTRAGSRTFYWYGRHDGRPIRYKLGKWPTMTVEQARTACKRAAGKFAEGHDLHLERKVERKGDTLSDLWQSYLEKHAKPHLRPSTWQASERHYDAHLKQWASRKAKTLTRQEVEAWHLKIGEASGHYMANRCLALLSVILAKGDIEPNPCRRVRKFREQSRDRFLQRDELPAFFAALDSEPNQVFADAIRMALFTGARIGNVLAMQWDEITLATQSWRIPDTKNRTPVVVPLVTEAMAVLDNRLAASDGGPWVFPGKRPGTHLQYPKSTWERLLKRAGIEGLRIHDLRRSLGSWQASAGTNLSIIGASLGHRSIQSTTVYARVQDDPVRASVGAAVAAMMAAVQPPERKRRAK